MSPGDTVVIAAHAEVEDDAGREEGAWGEGTRFVKRGNWAMYFEYVVQEAAVPCPSACIAGLNAFADTLSGISQAPDLACGFDENRQAGFVNASYVVPEAVVAGNICRATIGSRVFMLLEISNAEQASCAPLAVEILPLVDETNCDISPP